MKKFKEGLKNFARDFLKGVDGTTSIGKTYLFITFLFFMILLTIFSIFTISGKQIAKEQFEMIFGELEWILTILFGYVFGTKIVTGYFKSRVLNQQKETKEEKDQIYG